MTGSLCEKNCMITLWATAGIIKAYRQKIITVKHYGTHSYPIELKSRSKYVSKVAKEFPCLTRESMVTQKVQQQFKQSLLSASVTTSENCTNKTYIDNIKGNEKTKRRPDGYCFMGVKTLKTTFEKEYQC